MNFELKEADSRYERKFVIESHVDRDSVEMSVKLHPAMFSEIFEERQVNNIYLDTPRMDFYHDNVIGRSDRRKVRIRWYGELTGRIENPVLEYKIKRGVLGWKFVYPLPSFNVSEQISIEDIRMLFDKADFPKDVLEDVKCLNPVLMNYYTRKYFKSADGEFRITMDSEFAYYQIGNHNNSLLDQRLVESECVLELKYAFDTKVRPPEITSAIPFRISKNSKYVNGVGHFMPGLTG